MRKIYLFAALISVIVNNNYAQITALNGPPGGFVNSLIRTSSGTLFSVVSNSLYQSVNGGTSWTKVTIAAPASGINFEDIVIGPSKMYALTYSELFTSTDATNWTKVSTTSFYGVYRLKRFGPDGFLVASGWNGVWVSKDDGVTFTQILTENVYDDYKVSANSAGDLFVGTQTGIKRYLYPGAAGTYDPADWTVVYPISGNVYFINLGVDPSDNIYVSALWNDGTYSPRIIGRSTAANKGAVGTWDPIPPGDIATNDWSGFWAFSGTTVYYFNNGSGGKIYSQNTLATTTYSLTGGSTVKDNYSVSVANTAGVNVGDAITGTGIQSGTFVTGINNATSLNISNPCTADGTALTFTGTHLTNPWSIANSPTNPYGSGMRNVVFASATNYFIGSDGSGVFGTTNGSTFSQMSAGIFSGNGYSLAVANTTGRIIYINNYSTKGYWTSTDNGTTWTFVPLADYFRKVIKLADGTLLLHGDQIYRSTDNGATFTVASSIYTDVIVQDPNNTSAVNTNIVYCTNGMNIYKSTDSGQTWNPVSIPASNPVRPNTYIPYLWITTSGDLYFLQPEYNNSTNMDVWRLYKVSGGVTSILPNAPWVNEQYWGPNNLFIQNGKLYVTSYNAFYTTSDDGATWTTNGFSGNYVFPITQGGFSGIAVSRNGTLYTSQTDGKTFQSNQLPSSNSIVTNMVLDNTGKFIASAVNSTAIKFTGTLLVDPATITQPIDFGWVATGGPYGGPTEHLLIDNSNKVYTYSWRGYYKADVAVTTWSLINYPPQNNYLTDMTINKTTGKLYGIIYDKLFSSIDGATTWTEIVNSENIQSRNVLTLCPNGNLVLGANNNKIYVSTDGGTTFGAPKLTLGADEYFYDWEHPLITTSNNIILIKVNTPNGRYLKKSADAGATWNDITLPASGQKDVWRMSADQNGNIYVTTCCEIYKSTDGGATWTSIVGINSGWRYESKVYTSPTNEIYFPANGNNGGITLKKSTDGGATWTDLGNMGTYSIFDMKWVGTKIVAATFGGAIGSTDNGVTFTDISTGITNIIDGNVLVGSASRITVASADFTSKTENAGVSWARQPLGLRYFFDHPDGSTISVNTDGNTAYRTTDGGVTWVPYFTTNFGFNKYFTADGNSHYVLAYNEIYYSNNLTTWTKLTISGMPPPDKRNVTDLSADANGLVYCIIYNYNTNKQEAYQILFGSAILLNQVANPTTLFYKQGKTYLFGSEGILATTTNGSTWVKKAAPNGSKFSIEAKDYFFIYQYGGILWLSRDLGQSWQSVGLTPQISGSGFTDVAINELDGFAYAAINGSPVRKSDKIILPDDLTKPVLTAFSPANNSTGASIKPKLTITFDEGVVPQATKAIKILDVNNVNVPVETILVTDGVQNGKSYTFTLTNFLSYNTQYFVIIDVGAYKDIFGNTYDGLISQTAWRFTTKVTPSVTTTVPANNAVDVAITPSFSITFSEPMTGAASKNAYLYESASPSTPVATISITTPAPQYITMLPVGAAASQSVTIIFDATQGGKELMGATKVYAHAGVVTTNATGTNWNFVKGNWGSDDGIGLMTAVPGETDKWQITLGPTLREYFEVPTATPIYRLAILFHNASGNIKATQPATLPSGHFVASNGDYYIDLAQTAPACVATVRKEGSKMSIVGCNNLKNSTNYFIKFDPLALLSSEGQPLSLATTNSAWTFTTVAPPDTQAPAITYSPDTFAKGSANKTISATITDNVGVTSAKIFYRSITTGTSEISADLTLTNNKYEISIPESTFGTMGLELYFTAADAAGNTTRSPATSGYHYIRVTGPASGEVFPSGLLGSGGELAGWKIISVPMVTDGTPISSIFSELGEVDNTKWRMIRYKDESSDWSQYPKDFSTFKQGDGYFINVKTPPSQIIIDGATAPANTRASLFKMTLKPGWNLIGNPYAFPMKWSEILAFNTGVTTTGIATLKTYSNGAYVNSANNPIAAYEGAFVLNTGSAQVTIDVPVVTSLSGGRIPSAQEQKTESYDIGTDEWVVPITLKTGDVVNILGGVGMKKDALFGVDQFDDFNPPPVTDYVEMNFAHPEHFLKQSIRDFVPTQGEYMWKFTLGSSIDKPIELSWDNSIFGENSKDLLLVDVENGILIDMRKQNSYSARGKSGLFELHFGEDLRNKISPEKIVLGDAYPNPASGSVFIPFTLPERGSTCQTTLELYDPIGRKITNLVDKSLFSGFYTSQWDSDQSNLNSGVYIYKLTVIQEGKVEQFTKRLIINKSN